MSAIALMLTVLLSASVRVFSEDVPECKRGVKCVEYKVIGKAEHYEKRVYHERVTVGYFAYKGLPYNETRLESYRTLVSYLKGENARREEIDFVLPIVTAFGVMRRKTREKLYTAFFLPRSVQKRPPEGKYDVFLMPFPSNFYAASFSGFASKERVLEEEKKLRDNLVADGVAFDHERFYIFEYNTPMETGHRHNDVLYLAPYRVKFRNSKMPFDLSTEPYMI